MKTKKFLSTILALCMLLSALPNVVLAATAITEVNLTGDIIPVANGACNYLYLPSGANYTIWQYMGMSMNLWYDLESESPVTSFGTTGIYGYSIAITPKDGYAFSDSVTVTLNGDVLTKDSDYYIGTDKEASTTYLQIMKVYQVHLRYSIIISIIKIEVFTLILLSVSLNLILR